MNKAERDELLKGMRSALRNARDERESDRNMIHYYFECSKTLVEDYPLSSRGRESFKKASQEAKDRNMLDHANAEEMILKEEYKKRPSVRALKAFNRGNDGPGD